MPGVSSKIFLESFSQTTLDSSENAIKEECHGLAIWKNSWKHFVQKHLGLV